MASTRIETAIALCPVCHDTTAPHTHLCHNCLTHTKQLRRPPTPVTVIGIFDRSHPLRDTLHHYKNSTAADHHQARQTIINLLANTVPVLLPTGHTLTTVPSTHRQSHLHTIATQASLKPSTHSHREPTERPGS